jgi:hypothetical protein
MNPRSPGTKPEKMTNSEDPIRKVLNLAGQTDDKGLHAEEGKDLEDSGTDIGRRRRLTGPKWAQAGRPSPFWGLVSPHPL